MNQATRNTLFGFDKLLTEFYQPSRYAAAPASKPAKPFLSPRVDIQEHKDSYELIAELPGIEKGNISVTVEDSTLTITASAERLDDENNDRKVLRRERRLGKYQRRFDFGDGIEEAAINANFKDGLLTLSIPKLKEAEAEKRQIDIH